MRLIWQISSRDPLEAADNIQGQASADLAQKSRFVPVNPNKGMAPEMISTTAGVRAKVMNDLTQDATSQGAAAKRGYIDNAMGLQSSVNSAQTGMARDAVQRNIDDAAADYMGRAAIKSSFASGAGMAASIFKDYKTPPKTSVTKGG